MKKLCAFPISAVFCSPPDTNRRPQHSPPPSNSRSAITPYQSLTMPLEPPSRPPRHDGHRGKRRSASAPNNHPSVTQHRPANPRSSLYYNSAKSSRAARILPLRCQSSDHRRMVADAWLFVPEGHRRKLAGGKLAPAGAAPGCHAKRAMPQRGIGEVFGVAGTAAFSPALVASGRSSRPPSSGIPDQFFDAPLGHGATRHGVRGRRPLPRTCPRLISSGVPPGREPGRRALTKGNHRRGNGVPNSFGCGSAALCTSCLCGSSRSSRMKGYGQSLITNH